MGGHPQIDIDPATKNGELPLQSFGSTSVRDELVVRWLTGKPGNFLRCGSSYYRVLKGGVQGEGVTGEP